MRGKILRLVAALPLHSGMTSAQETGNAEDVTAIRQVVQFYFEGWKNDGPESMKKAFHPKAKLFAISEDNDLKETSQKQDSRRPSGSLSAACPQSSRSARPQRHEN